MKKTTFFLACTVLLVLLSSCSWREFSDGVDTVEKELLKLFSISPGKDKEPEVPAVEECVSQECMENAFRQCLWAKGNYTDSQGRLLELVIDSMESVKQRFGQTADFCYVTMRILRSWNASEQGAVYYCKVPRERLDDPLERTFTTASPFCGGTMFEEMKPEVKFRTYSDAGLKITQFNISGEEIVFDFTPSTKLVYLKRLEVTGPFFDNCTLENKNPVKLPKGARQVMTIGCSGIQAESTRAYGDFTVSYYEKPDFLNLTTVQGSFVGAVQ